MLLEAANRADLEITWFNFNNQQTEELKDVKGLILNSKEFSLFSLMEFRHWKTWLRVTTTTETWWNLDSKQPAPTLICTQDEQVRLSLSLPLLCAT